VAGYPVTPEAARVAIDEAAERSYGQARAHLERHHGLRLGKELLENLGTTLGAYWLERDKAALRPNGLLFAAPAAQIPAQQCLIFADGVMVHTDGAWHETRVGTVRSTTADGEVHKSSIARKGELDEFGQDLWRKAHQMGYGKASVTAFLADGSHWLWGLAESRFGRAVQILDFWHVCEHVGACAKEFFGEGTEDSRQWSLKVCGTLRAGLGREAMKEVESLMARTAAKREAKHTLVTYLTNNLSRMDYPRYEKLGLPVGSGEVEAQCKTLVQARCKQAGMRWGSTGLNALLRVRCAVKDGSFDDAFTRQTAGLLAWKARRKRAARIAA
jgi:hypothetical protein